MSPAASPVFEFKMSRVALHRRRARMTALLAATPPRTLNCRLEDIDDDDLLELSEISEEDLEVMDLEYNQISPLGLRSMVLFRCHQLTLLNLNYNTIGSHGIKLISAVPLPALTAASFTRNKIDERGFRHLSKANWPTLKSLCLSQNNGGMEGLSALLGGNWSKLQFINLSNNRLQSLWKTVRLLKGEWPRLKVIRICTNVFTWEGSSTFEKTTDLIESWLFHKFADLSTLEFEE